MTVTTTGMTPTEVGATHIHWGLNVFAFGLVIGFIPLAHCMHGSMEQVGEEFLKNVTLWWGCAFQLAVDVALIGGLSIIAIGLCHVVLAQNGAMTSVTTAGRLAPALCVAGILSEFVAGVRATTPSPQSGRTSTTCRSRSEKSRGSECR